MDHLITIYTDGACPNNGSEFASGGWAAILESNGRQLRLSGSDTSATNNKMELRAILEGLKAIKATSANVVLYTDSAYARNGCKTWIHSWKRNGWKRPKNKPIENLELWQEIGALLERHTVEARWVPAHSGIPQNELADRLAVAASRGRTVREYRNAGDYQLDGTAVDSGTDPQPVKKPVTTRHRHRIKTKVTRVPTRPPLLPPLTKLSCRGSRKG